MTSKYIISLMFIFSLSCNGQTVTMKGEKITNAKWYYYSYAAELKTYDKSGAEVQPLACDVKLLRVSKVSIDTTEVFFVASNKDTSNTCSFKPLDLVGITVVRNKLYLPIYRTVVFDSESDSVVLERMNKQNLLLQNKVLADSRNIIPWLQAEVKRRENK